MGRLSATPTNRMKPARWVLSPGLVAPQWRHIWSKNLLVALALWESAGKPQLYGLQPPTVITDAPTWAATKAGIGWTFNGTTEFFRMTTSAPLRTGDTVATIVIVMTMNSLSATHPIYATYDNGSNTQVIRLAATAAGTLQILCKAAADLFRHTTTGWVSGEFYTIVLRFGTGGNDIWRNGIKLAPSYTSGDASTAGYWAALTQIAPRWGFNFTSLAGGDEFGDHTYHAFYYFNERLSDAEIFKLSLDPFGPFRMARRRIPAAVAVGNPWYAYANQ